MFKIISLLIIAILLLPSGIVRSGTNSNPPVDFNWPPEERLVHRLMEELPHEEVDYPEEIRDDLLQPQQANRASAEVERERASIPDEEQFRGLIYEESHHAQDQIIDERRRLEKRLSENLITLLAMPAVDQVHSSGWAANTPVTLTIGQNAWTKTSSDSGYVIFYLNDYQFDLVGGQLISMTDGTNTITHMVFPIAVTAIDEAADTVTGTTWPNNVLEIYACDNSSCQFIDIGSDANGNWVANFSGLLDIRPGVGGYVRQYDEEGDETAVYWSVPDPHLTAYPVQNWIETYGWHQNTPLTLTIGQNSWTKTTSTSDYLTFYLNDYQFDLAGGQLISITDGVRTITHTVFPTEVTAIDESTDTVSGTTWPNNVLEIYGCDNSSCSLSLDIGSDANGYWVANFSGLFDILPGTYGYVLQDDEDGDRTAVYWFVSNPRLNAYPVDNRVYTYDWPAYTPLTLTIGQNAWTKTSDSGGYASFYLNDYQFDLVGGHLISITDGVRTISHMVFPISVTGIDEAADTVTGTTWPNNSLEIYGCDNSSCQFIDINSDANGNWVANFSGLIDILPGTYGYARQYDEDGDRTSVYWYVPDPRLTAYPVYNQVSTNDWPAYTPLTLTIGQNAWTKTSDSGGYAYFYLDDYQFDLVGGQLISITDGVRAITHMVFPTEVTAIDEAADTVTGTTWPNNTLLIYGCGDGSCSPTLEIGSDANGNWVANFSGLFDILPGTYGYVRQYDEDGDGTAVRWYVPDPRLTAYPVYNQVSTNDWPAYTPLTLTIGQNAWTKTSDSGGYARFYLNDYQFDLVGGQLISITDGVRAITHMVFPTEVTAIDEAADTVTGTTWPNNTLLIYGCGDGSCSPTLEIGSDANGNWVANFSGLFDILPGTYGYVRQYDEDGDGTAVRWYVPDPRLVAYPVDNYVYTYDWPAYTPLTLTIGQNSWTKPSDSGGSARFYLDDYQFDLVGGQLISITDGVRTITHMVFPIAVTTIDEAADTVSGIAWPNDSLEIYGCGDGSCSPTLEIGSDANGYWVANFSGLLDILPGTYGYVFQYDEDGDETAVRWYVPDPRLTAYPVDNWVDTYDWPAYTPLTLTIGQNAWTKTSDSGGYAYFYLDDYQFDLVGGHLISITDGVRTISHTVFPIAVTAIDESADTVTGTTWPNNPLEIYGCGDGSCSPTLKISSDANGNWVANFSGLLDILPGTYGYVRQYDEDGDETAVYWYVPDPQLRAHLTYDEVVGMYWPAYTPITLTIGQNSWTETSDGSGYAYFDLGSDGFDLIGNQKLTMNGGKFSITHTTFNLAIWDINQRNDYVNGLGAPSREIEIYVRSFLGSQGYDRTILTTDSTGYWVTYLAGKVDIGPGTYASVLQSDDNQNTTYIYQMIEPLRVYLPTVNK